MSSNLARIALFPGLWRPKLEVVAHTYEEEFFEREPGVDRGVEAHKRTHTQVAADALGRSLGDRRVTHTLERDLPRTGSAWCGGPRAPLPLPLNVCVAR